MSIDPPPGWESYAIRRATEADAAAIASAGRHLFVQAFGADNTPSDLALYLPAAFGEALQRGEINDPSFTYLVVHDRDELVAYALLRAGSHHSAVEGEAPVEIQRFYVEQRYHGRGLAVQLMRACMASASAAGGQTVWLGVWDRNARAIRFYEKCGFLDVGSQPFLLGADRQTDRVMMRVIGRGAASETQAGTIRASGSVVSPSS